MAYFFSTGNTNNLKTAFIYFAVLLTAFLFVWFELKLLLLAFAGVLLAIVLQAITAWIDRKTRLNFMGSYLLTLLLVGGVIIGGAYLLIPRLLTQVAQIANDLPNSLHQLEQPLAQRPWGPQLIAEGHHLAFGPETADKLPSVARAISGGILNHFLILVIGIFAALNPRGYHDGLLVLIPESRREFWAQVGEELHTQLKWWLIGQTITMVAMGTACGLSLWLLRVPLAGTLGVLTGIAVFFPYVGTFAAGIPSVLMGLQRGPRTALYVLIVYTILHLIEGYILGPLVQRRIVHLPRFSPSSRSFSCGMSLESLG